MPEWASAVIVGLSGLVFAALGVIVGRRLCDRLGGETHEVQIGRVGDRPIFRNQDTIASLSPGCLAPVGFAVGAFVAYFLLDLVFTTTR